MPNAVGFRLGWCNRTDKPSDETTLKRRRLQKKMPLLGTLLVLVLVVAVYVIGFAWIPSRLFANYEFGDLLGPRLVDVTIVLWLIYFCSSIGSFLNVVAWRMPRGDGIGGRSYCPRCANTLKKRDNVPILGWISLRGRCRFCSLPISRRYPIVESLVGLTLTIIGITQIYGLSLPSQMVHGHGALLWSPSFSQTSLAILTYHAVAVATLWAMTLIRIDGTRLPTKLALFASVAVIVPMLVYPTVMVVPWQASRPAGWTPDGRYVDAVMRIATALVAAALTGRVLAKGLCPSADLKMDPLGGGTKRLVDLITMLSIPAVVIGWQSIPALVITAAVLSFLLRPLLDAIPVNDGPKGQITRRGTLESYAFALPFALTLHLVLWRVLWSTSFWPSDQSSRNVIIIASLLVLAVPIFLREPKAAELEQAESEPADDEALSGADELPENHRDGESDQGNHRGNDAPGP
jgi:leader peptidase (prepilin peptidase)/N-methyltransferase